MQPSPPQTIHHASANSTQGTYKNKNKSRDEIKKLAASPARHARKLSSCSLAWLTLQAVPDAPCTLAAVAAASRAARMRLRAMRPFTGANNGQVSGAGANDHDVQPRAPRAEAESSWSNSAEKSLVSVQLARLPVNDGQVGKIDPIFESSWFQIYKKCFQLERREIKKRKAFAFST